MIVKLDLRRNYCDSLDNNHSGVIFPVWLALAEISSIYDWNIIILSSTGKFVYDPFVFEIKVERCYTRGYDTKDKWYSQENSNYAGFLFKIKAKSYSTDEIYIATKNTLERLKNGKLKAK